MEEKARTRPTKKQFELLKFIEQFIAEHGYGPSYREIMAGLNYTSVATVAVHVNNLVASGHLIKKDQSARSLEVAKDTGGLNPKKQINITAPADEKWLAAQIERRFEAAEADQPTSQEVDDLYVLIGALKILGVKNAAQAFIQRLSLLKNKL